MAKKGLLTRIIENFEKIKNDTLDEEFEPRRGDEPPKFIVPSDEVLNLMENNQPLSMWQINEVMAYIKSNYYFCEDKRILNDFAFEWTRCEGGVEQVLNRMKLATANIVDDLSCGKSINARDALWISYKIYASDTNIEKSRIISKQIQDGCVTFDVVSQAKDPKVFSHIMALAKQLNANKYAKTFANTY